MQDSSDRRSQTKPSALRRISAIAGSVGVSQSQPMTARQAGVTLTPPARRLFKTLSVSASSVSGRVSVITALVMGSVGMAFYSESSRPAFHPCKTRAEPPVLHHAGKRSRDGLLGSRGQNDPARDPTSASTATSRLHRRRPQRGPNRSPRRHVDTRPSF